MTTAYFTGSAYQCGENASATPTSGAFMKLRESDVSLPTTGSALSATTAMPT